MRFTAELAEKILRPLGLTQTAIPEVDRKQMLEQTTRILDEWLNAAPKARRMRDGEEEFLEDIWVVLDGEWFKGEPEAHLLRIEPLTQPRKEKGET